jgi:hypothetical protein
MINYFKKLFGLDKSQESEQVAPYKVETPPVVGKPADEHVEAPAPAMPAPAPAPAPAHADNPNKVVAVEKVQKPKRKPAAIKANTEKKATGTKKAPKTPKE